jgi:fructose-bisphosphate aldolase/2-amino-3,7-dideoxy-D-threo-hept-6-ulosonate synthase
MRLEDLKYSSMTLNLGKIIRAGNLLADDGKALVVALDHGMIGITRGIEHMGRVIDQVMKGGADGVLITLGAAKRLALKLSGKISIVLSIPFDPKYVELAAKIGADAVKTMYFGKVPLEWDQMGKISEVAETAEDWGMIYMVEVVPVDESGKIIYDLEKIKQAARIGSELGGDIVKTAYVGPPSSYRKEVVDSCLAPIMIMGGPRMETARETLAIVKEAMDAGAVGGVIGRNIWQHTNPEKMTHVISAIIHENMEVDEALKILEE